MVLTENEARGKWCPFGRELRVYESEIVNLAAVTAVNRDYGEASCPCLASGCMAWRWSNHSRLDGTATGYCGLAGGTTG